MASQRLSRPLNLTYSKLEEEKKLFKLINEKRVSGATSASSRFMISPFNGESVLLEDLFKEIHYAFDSSEHMTQAEAMMRPVVPWPLRMGSYHQYHLGNDFREFPVPETLDMVERIPNMDPYGEPIIDEDTGEMEFIMVTENMRKTNRRNLRKSMQEQNSKVAKLIAYCCKEITDRITTSVMDQMRLLVTKPCPYSYIIYLKNTYGSGNLLQFSTTLTDVDTS